MWPLQGNCVGASMQLLIKRLTKAINQDVFKLQSFMRVRSFNNKFTKCLCLLGCINYFRKARTVFQYSIENCHNMQYASMSFPDAPMSFLHAVIYIQSAICKITNNGRQPRCCRIITKYSLSVYFTCLGPFVVLKIGQRM